MAKRASKRIKRVITILVLLAVLLGGGYYVYQTYIAQKSAQSPAQTKPVSDTQGKAGYTSTEITAQISQASDNQKKADLYTQLAQSQAFSGDNKSAAESAKQAAELMGTSDSYATAAGRYAKIGDNATAIMYFKKALKLVPKSTDPTENTPYNYYSAKIVELGGTI